MSSTQAVSEASTDGPSGPREQLGKRERNKLDKQRRIVKAATELFQKQGFDETTTAEIAAKAEIGAGTLYLYVGSKEDLLESVFETVAGDAWNKAFELLDCQAPLVQQITDLFLHVTDHHEADRRLAKSFFKELPWLEASTVQGADDFVAGFLRRIEDVLSKAADRGQLEPAVPRQVLAHSLYALWVVEIRRRSGGRQTYDDMVARIIASFRLALWGMTPETS